MTAEIEIGEIGFSAYIFGQNGIFGRNLGKSSAKMLISAEPNNVSESRKGAENEFLVKRQSFSKLRFEEPRIASSVVVK